MKFEVTLKQLRENEACVEGYNKVVCMLKGVEYESRDSYMRFKHDEPISLISIANNNGIDDALWCLRCNNEWNRDARLFAVWCARQVQHLMNDDRSVIALNVAENYANGLATDEERSAARDAALDADRDAALDAAWSAAWSAALDAALDAARSAAWSAAWSAARSAARSAAWSAAWSAALDAARDAAWSAAWSAALDADRSAAWSAAWAAQKEMFIKMCNGEAPWQN